MRGRGVTRGVTKNELSAIPYSGALSAYPLTQGAGAAPRRLMLVSSRVVLADVLMEAADDSVVAVYFDWRFSTLEKIVYECKKRLGFADAGLPPGSEGGPPLLRSVGLMTHHKVRRCRLRSG